MNKIDTLNEDYLEYIRVRNLHIKTDKMKQWLVKHPTNIKGGDEYNDAESKEDKAGQTLLLKVDCLVDIPQRAKAPELFQHDKHP